MKTKKIALFCILTALAVLAGGFAWLYLSPGGVLRPNGPEEYMQSLLASSTSADWQERIGESWDKAVSEFEEAADIYGKTFSAAANGEFSFREYEPVFRRRKPVYILSAGETDLCLVALRYDDGWQIGDITVPAGLLEAERRTVSVTVPAGAEVYVNGILLEEHHRKEDFVPYEDMKPLEGRYTAVPHRQRWEVAGLYETPELSVRLQGTELPLESRTGENHSYLPPDARAYSFRFFAPAESIVSINGAVLGETDSVGVQPLPLPLNLSEEQQGGLPPYRLYALDGLYAAPEISVTMGERTLAPAEWAGETVYPAVEDIPPEISTLVETYLTNYCHFGAHHYGYDMLLPYVVEKGELWDFHVNAQASLLGVGDGISR